MENIISTNIMASANNAAPAKNIISTNNMNKRHLNKLSKTQLINLLLKQNAEIKLLWHQQVEQQSKINADDKPRKPVPAPRRSVKPRKPVPTPRKSVKQMVQEYGDNIILPPLKFRDDYKPIPKS